MATRDDVTARNLRFSVVLGLALIALVSVLTVAIKLGSTHKMSWGERVSRGESYLYVDGETLTQDDLAYIARLKHLSSLTLTNCNVAECRLSELRFSSDHLWSLDLSGTKGLWDLSFLSDLSVSNLTLNDCPGISDISMLNWSELSDLEIDGTEVTDLSPVAGSQLSSISFARTAVSDITPLAGLRSLWEVDGSYTQVSSLEALAGLDRLWRVRFDGCPIERQTTPFASSRLSQLSLAHTPVSDLSGFASCTNIEELNLDACTQLTDLSWLRSQCYETLTKLDLGRCNFSAADVAWVASCTRLEELTLDGISLGNLECCRKLTELKLLSALDCNLTDISGLARCSGLRTILLGFNQLTSIDKLPQPEGEYVSMLIDVSHNQLTSLSGLPAVRYKCLLTQGNPTSLGRTLPKEAEIYDLAMDWYAGMEDVGRNEDYSYTAIYLLGCPQEKQRVVSDAYGSWRLRHVSEQELLDLLRRDELSYGLWEDLSSYVEIASSFL